MSRKNSRTAWTVRKNIFSFVDEALIPESFCNPPDRLHELRIHCLVVVIKIYPAAHTGNCCAPFRSILQNRSAAGIIKFVDTEGFNFVLRVKTKLFFNQVFNRKTVTVPAKAALNAFSLHCLIAWNNIFNG